MAKLLGLMLVTFLLISGRSVAQAHALVIAVDLSQSIAVTGPDHKTEFQKNIDAVSKLLAQVPADSRATVIGITDKSFVQPDVVLSATISDDAGYFGERLNSARLQLVRVWKVRSGQLTPGFRQTDILGALMLASEIFNQQPSPKEKVLIVFSDMRQQTKELDLEMPSLAPSFNQIVTKGAKIEIANLGNVHLRALGVDGAGKSIPYWQSLRKFWTEYFRTSGARLESYTVMREAMK
jgi:von Willebrand factor type A domain